MAMGGRVHIDLPIGCEGWHQKTALNRGILPHKLMTTNYEEWLQIRLDNYATIKDFDGWAQSQIEGRA